MQCAKDIMFTMIMKSNKKSVKKKDLKWWFEHKDAGSTAKSARESSGNILGWNRKQELGLNYNGE